MKMTKTAGGIVCDLSGTGAQARGPINHAGDYADGLFLRKWMACILRNLAESPERAAELDINEGVCDLLQLRFPPPGTLVTPEFNLQALDGVLDEVRFYDRLLDNAELAAIE